MSRVFLGLVQGSVREFFHTPSLWDEVSDSLLTRCRTDPMVHHGRHFGRTIQAFCQVHLLLKQGLARTIQLELGGATVEDLKQAGCDTPYCQDGLFRLMMFD